LLSSGPRAGLGEITLPQRQAGSSIMPGKVNPIIPEAVNQAAFQVMSGDLAITLAAQSGQLELNAFMPLIAHHLLGNLELLANSARIFRELCIEGIVACEERCRQMLENSLVTVTALAPHIGYDLASHIARLAGASGRPIREVAARNSGLTAEELDKILNPLTMTSPGMVRLVGHS
jgi:aspartate ammonia-lyase